MRAENSRGKLDPRRIDPTSLFGIVYIFGAFIYLWACVCVDMGFFVRFVCSFTCIAFSRNETLLRCKTVSIEKYAELACIWCEVSRL